MRGCSIYLDLGDGQDEDDEGKEDDERDWHNDHQSIEAPTMQYSQLSLASIGHFILGDLRDAPHQRASNLQQREARQASTTCMNLQFSSLMGRKRSAL